MSSDKYQVIDTPTNIWNAKPYLGRLEKEACFGIVHGGQLQVWTLKESYGKMEWALRYQDDLSCYAHYLASLRIHCGLNIVGPWIVKERNVSVQYNSNHTAGTLSEEAFEWDSDNDDTISVTAGGEEDYWGDLDILGFHPYKKVVFLVESFRVINGLSYEHNEGSISRLLTPTLLLSQPFKWYTRVIRVYSMYDWGA